MQNKEEKQANCAIKGLAHIGVFVKDLQKSLVFYTEILGFDCYSKAEVPDGKGIIKVAFVKQGTCEFELVQFPRYDERPAGLVDHIALKVMDLDAVMVCLLKKGVVFETKEPIMIPEDIDSAKYINLFGPDGEKIELLQ